MTHSPVTCGIKAAMGIEEYDLVIRNTQYVNLFTKEIYTSDIGIKNGIIACVTQPGDPPLLCTNEYDAHGRYAIPGLIDTHVHIESSMMTPANMARTIIPHGTTTIACDPHEIANVAGLEGVNYILEASKDIPLSVFILTPSCVPSVVNLETAGAEFGVNEISQIFNSSPRVIGLGEVMDFPGVISCQHRITSILDYVRPLNRFMQGHCPLLTGPNLSAYQTSGVNSCHETAYTDEALYKLRAGMTLECRESSIARNIKAIMPAIITCHYPPNTTLCTDDREPDDLLSEGHIDHVLRRCVEEGGDVIEIIRMATYNAARLLRLYDRGSITPGLRADIILLDSLTPFKVNEVFIAGKLTAKGGNIYNDFTTPVLPFESTNTVHINHRMTADDFTIHLDVADGEVDLNMIRLDDDYPVVSHLHHQCLPISGGKVIVNQEDIVYLSVFERHGKKGSSSICLLKNSGLKAGAIASTVSHDCHNLVVIGKNPEDMAIAANELIESGGGFCCVRNSSILASLDLPIGGLISPLPVEKMAPQTKHLKEVITDLGLRGSCPIIQVASFALPVIPHVRLTDMGLVDIETQKFLPLIHRED